MFNSALGMIETYGIPPAIAAIDTAVKSANISVLPKVIVGGGLVVVLFRGDVSSVSIAVESGVAAASMVGEVLSSHVIARVHEDVEAILPKDLNYQTETKPIHAPVITEEKKVYEKKVVDNSFVKTESVKVEKTEKEGKENFEAYLSTNKESNVYKVKEAPKKEAVKNTSEKAGSEKKVDVINKNNNKKKKKR